MVILLFQGALANCIGVCQNLVNWVGFWHPVVRGQVHHATRHHLDWRWTQRRATRQSYPTLSMWVLDIIIMVLVGVTWNIVFHLLTRITGVGGGGCEPVLMFSSTFVIANQWVFFILTITNKKLYHLGLREKNKRKQCDVWWSHQLWTWQIIKCFSFWLSQTNHIT